MIIVEKMGKLNTYRVQCNECESILQYDNKEEKISINGGIYGIEEKHYIYCPVCGSKVCTIVRGEYYIVDFRLNQENI